MFDWNTFKDKRHLLILVAITLPSKKYSSATSLCGRSPKSRRRTYLEEIAHVQHF